eukprot:Sspe_Gene.25666::Locus_10362_Transcript_2_2_Confidence_0.667_Length_2376::g.25666::m.25666
MDPSHDGLHLILDVDNTLLHAFQAAEQVSNTFTCQPEEIGKPLYTVWRDRIAQGKPLDEIYEKIHPISFIHNGVKRVAYVKLRPMLFESLEMLRPLGTLHIYSKGQQAYISEVLKLLVGDYGSHSDLINGRVTTKCDDPCTQKDLRRILPEGHHHRALAIDDQPRVWVQLDSVIPVPPYFVEIPVTSKTHFLPVLASHALQICHCMGSSGCTAREAIRLWRSNALRSVGIRVHLPKGLSADDNLHQWVVEHGAHVAPEADAGVTHIVTDREISVSHPSAKPVDLQWLYDTVLYVCPMNEEYYPVGAPLKELERNIADRARLDLRTIICQNGQVAEPPPLRAPLLLKASDDQIFAPLEDPEYRRAEEVMSDESCLPGDHLLSADTVPSPQAKAARKRRSRLTLQAISSIIAAVAALALVKGASPLRYLRGLLELSAEDDDPGLWKVDLPASSPLRGLLLDSDRIGGVYRGHLLDCPEATLYPGEHSVYDYLGGDDGSGRLQPLTFLDRLASDTLGDTLHLVVVREGYSRGDVLRVVVSVGHLLLGTLQHIAATIIADEPCLGGKTITTVETTLELLNAEGPPLPPRRFVPPPPMPKGWRVASRVTPPPVPKGLASTQPRVLPPPTPKGLRPSVGGAKRSLSSPPPLSPPKVPRPFPVSTARDIHHSRRIPPLRGEGRCGTLPPVPSGLHPDPSHHSLSRRTHPTVPTS